MEYKDYRTDETISRDQYIASGLERGELLILLDCGCVVIQDRTVDAYMVYCPLHEAAPDLYEACKAQHDAIDRLFAELIGHEKLYLPSQSGQPWEAMLQGNKAIAKVEKGE